MPTLQRLADNGLTYSQWHTTALCSPTRSVFLTGRNHHQNGFASISETSTGFPGYNSHIPRENASMATVLRDAGWSTFWVGKNHNTPVDAWTMGSSKKDWPLGLGLRPLLRLHRRRDEPVVSRPRRGQPLHRASRTARGRLPPLQGPGRQGARVHPRLQAVRAGQAVVPVVLPGREPRAAPRAAGVHRQVQGQVRRRLRGLPRVGAAAHDRAGDPARGHRADADQPDDAGHVQRGRLGAAVGHALRRREAAVLAAWPRSTPPSPSTPTHQVGRIIDYLEESGQLDNTLILYCADNGASGEGSPNGSVNENKFFNAWPDTIEDNLALIDKLGSPDDLQPLPDGLGGGLLDAVPDVQALLVPGRRLRPAGDPLAEGHQGPRRGAPPVPPLHRHRPDDPRLLRRRDAGGRRRLRADAAPRRVDALLVRRGRRADAQGDAVLRDARHARHLAQGLEGGRRARPGADRTSASSTRTAGSSSTPTRTAPRRTTSPSSTRRSSRSSRRCGSRRRRSTTSCRSTTSAIFEFRALEYAIAGPRERPVHLLPGHQRDAGGLGGRNPRTSRTRSSPRSSSPRTPRA